MPTDKIRSTDWAWLAGFFDGDGSITAADYAAHKFRIRVSFGQKDPAPLLKVRDMIGGHLRCKEQDHPGTFSPGHMHYLSYGGKASFEILQQILPYVIAKREQVLIALQLHGLPREQQAPLAAKLKELKRTYVSCELI